MQVPFNLLQCWGREFEYMRDAVVSGHASGDGKYTQKCHQLLQSELGVNKVLLTTSCSHALEMACLLLNLAPGDEVIVPSFTFVSAANAVVLRGATPVFVDIRPDTLNLDEAQLPDLITDRTKAIIPVHYAGVACEMDRMLEVTAPRGIAVVEDNAHGLFGRYRGRYLGTFGCLATQSFHETKNISCGEGGALLLNDPRYIERAEIIREKGTNRSRFFRGQVDKYTWVDAGSSYLPSDILGAFLFAQLECRKEIQAARRRVWMTYDAALHEWAARNNVRLPFVPEHCEQSYHMYYIITPSLNFRQRLMSYLKQLGILSVFHYQPLHLSDAGQRFGRNKGCPVTEHVADRLLRLPFYGGLTEDVQQSVIDALRSFNGA